MYRKRMIPIGLLCTMLALSGCGNETDTQEQTDTVVSSVSESETEDDSTATDTVAQRDIFAMDTYMSVVAYGEHCEEAVAAAEEEIYRLDDLLSTGSEESEVTLLNQAGGGTLSTETAFLMDASISLYESTEGAFHPAIYPLVSLWGFPTGEYKVPTGQEIEAVLPLTDMNYLDYDSENQQLSLEKEGMAIDFGGIAKGYTSSSIADIFHEYGIESGLINLGGNVQVIGAKVDGTKWNVAIQNPEGDGSYLGVVSVEDKAVITSGGYERYFEEDGVTYHHIIDPSTGAPADSGLTSVSIISEDGTNADGLSTSLFVMGYEKAAAYWQEHREEFDMILLDEAGQIYVTSGITEDFTSDYEVTVIE